LGEISKLEVHTAAAIVQQLDAILGVTREECGELRNTSFGPYLHLIFGSFPMSRFLCIQLNEAGIIWTMSKEELSVRFLMDGIN